MHSGTAQVYVTVAEPYHLVDLGALVKWEGRRFGGSQHDHLGGLHLDCAGGQVVVGRFVGAFPDVAGHLEDVLGTEVVGPVDDHLDDAAAVAEVHEG